MKMRYEFVVLLLAALMIGQPMVAVAGSGARVIPDGQVNLVDGKDVVGTFRSEMPLPQGFMMACKGTCLVQSPELQLMAQDSSVFSLGDAGEKWDLTVMSGRVDFAMRSQVKPVAFHTPHDVIQTQQVILPADNAGMVKGYVTVSPDRTELNVTEGALQVMTTSGAQLVNPDHGLILAQATGTTIKQGAGAAPAVVPQGSGAAGAAGGAGTGAGGGATGGMFGGMSTAGMIGAGVVGAGVIAGVVVAATDTGSDSPQ